MLIDEKNNFNILIKILIYGIIILLNFSTSSKIDDPPLLPNNAYPIHYTIKLTPNIEDEKNLTFDGESYIEFEIKIKTEILTLNAKNLHIIGDVTVINQTHNWTTYDYSIDTKTDFLTIKFNEKLYEGNFTLHIYYNGNINIKSMKGFIYSTYNDESEDKQWLVLTNFDENFAREIMPCWDEPSTLATFEIFIKHKRKYTALSNTQYDSIISDKNKFNYVWTRFEKTPRLSVRTVALVMGDLEYLSDDNNAYRVWTSKNAKNHRKFFATMGGKAWKAMENITGINHKEYVLKKIDIVVIPDSEEWEMLFWGLSVLSKQDIPYDGYGNIENRNKFLILISQLLYDQWILNTDITLDNFDNSHLNFDLRRYIAVCMADQIEQSWDVKEKYFHDIQENIHRPGFITRTVANIFGKDKFRNVLRRFILDNKFGGKSAVNLIDEYALALDSNEMTEILKSALINWMTTPGYPIIYVDKKSVDKISITQQRFTINKYVKLQNKYWIPISCATENNPNFDDLSDIKWFDPYKSSLTIPGVPKNSWIICNKRGFGDYRVNYNEENWELIINYLKNYDYNKIDPLNRAQLIDDVFSIAKAGFFNYNIPLKLMGYLHHETDHHPWVEFWRQLEYLYYNTPLQNSKYYNAFKNYLLDQTTALEKKVLTDLIFYQDVHYLIKFQKASILKWTCKFESLYCQSYAFEKLIKWLDNPKRYPIDEFYKSVLLCSGIRNADENTWNQLYKKYTTDKEDHILQALVCTLNSDILKNFLKLVFNSTLEGYDNAQDLWKIFDIILIENDVGVEVILDSLLEIQKNFPDTDARYEFVHIGIFTVKNKIKNNKQKKIFENILKNDIQRIGSTKINSKLKEAEASIHLVQSQSTFLAEYFSN